MTTQVVYGRQRELVFQTVCQLCVTLHQPLFLTGLVRTMKQDAILQRALRTLHNHSTLVLVSVSTEVHLMYSNQVCWSNKSFAAVSEEGTVCVANSPHLLLPLLDRIAPCNTGTLLHTCGREGLHPVQPTTACIGPEPAQTQEL